MIKIEKKKILFLIVISIILLLSIFLTLKTSKNVKREYYDYEIDAINKMEELQNKVVEYKKDLNIPCKEVIYYDEKKTKIDEGRSYLIGDEFTGITTTIGDIKAKRTAASKESAALMVHILYENGVREGDTIAAHLTGSFLGYDIALLAACEVMKVKLIYTISFGSSMYGANQPALTFPDMLIKFINDGLITNEPIAISVGGDFDVGEEMMPEVRDEVKERLEKSKYEFINIRNYKDNINYRLKLFNQYDFNFFMSVGGSLVCLGQGNSEDKKGLLQIYEDMGKKTMQIIDIKKLVSIYGMDFDMPTDVHSKTDLYYEKKYNILIPIGAIVLSVLLLIYYKKKEYVLKSEEEK